MGFKISWLAAGGVHKAALLAALGFCDTHDEDEANEAPFSAADLGNGWSLIWSNDPEWVTDDLLARSPSRGRSVAVRLHEGVMWAEAFGVEGTGPWRVVHDAEEGLTHLEVEGVPPSFELIRDRLFAKQAADEEEMVDHVFDVPLTVAAELTGFRHDDWEMPHGERPRFTKVVATAIPR